MASAQRSFPVGESVTGHPSFELFEAGPLKAAKEFFKRRFDEAPEALSGTGIKVWLTIDVPFFPPMAFYAALLEGHGGREYVELVDVTVENPQDYWALSDDDPDD